MATSCYCSPSSARRVSPVVHIVQCVAPLGSTEQLVNLVHLGRCERAKTQRPAIILHLLHRLETWDWDRPLAAGPEPTQRSLGQGAAVAGQHVAQRPQLPQLLGLSPDPEVPLVPHVVRWQLGVSATLAG